MSTGAWTSSHDEQGKEEDVRQSSIGGSLRSTEIADGSIYEAR